MKITKGIGQRVFILILLFFIGFNVILHFHIYSLELFYTEGGGDGSGNDDVDIFVEDGEDGEGGIATATAAAAAAEGRSGGGRKRKELNDNHVEKKGHEIDHGSGVKIKMDDDGLFNVQFNQQDDHENKRKKIGAEPLQPSKAQIDDENEHENNAQYNYIILDVKSQDDDESCDGEKELSSNSLHNNNNRHYHHDRQEIIINDSSNINHSTNNIVTKQILTGAWIRPFWAGFCNQYFMFIGIIFLSNDLKPSSNNNDGDNTKQQHNSDRVGKNDYVKTISSTTSNTAQLEYQYSNQLYLPGLQWKDLYGTDEHIRHEVLFDVQYWNTFYPKLPKLVSHFDHDIHDHNNHNTSSSSTSTLFTDVFLHYDENRTPESIPTTQQEIINHKGLAPRIIWNHTNLPIEQTRNYERMINATNPYPMLENAQSALNQYKIFSRRYYRDHNKELVTSEKKFEIGPKQRMRMDQYRLILKDAFRPHPELQSIIDSFKASLGNDTSNRHGSGIEGDNDSSTLPNSGGNNDCSNGSTTAATTASPFMVLHARIEPDMQKHPMCKEKKVTNITHIINAIYDTYPTPPTSKMIILLNKQLLEDEVYKSENNDNNIMAEYNLRILEDILQNGLWDGQTDVIEAGSKLAIESNHEIYSRYHTLVGGIINFFLSLDAEIFIGSEVSSYSTSVVNSRYFRYNDDSHTVVSEGEEEGRRRRRRRNYFYDPQGLHSTDEVHRFQC